ncbi:MAG: ABC transporter permease subunit [Ignavibacteriaceae bacterium]|nr:ABC transporter permease subunit [Ignavibacteriaceae bacterium]
MKLVKKILLYEIHNTIRSKWVILYTFFFFLVGYGLFTFSGDVNKAYISLMNIIIIVIPLVSIIFGSIYFYNSREFIEMMLSQPIDRKSLYIGIFLGTAIPLSAGFGIGFSLPFILFGKVSEQIEGFFLLLLIGILLTFVFIALSFLISVKQDDKSKGLGLAILIWLILAVVYDGIVLLVIYYFQDYPLENAMIVLSAFNPIDLGRILFLMKFDIAALMGYTGAVFQRFFGSPLGVIVSIICLLAWIVIPFFLSHRFFKKKDF